MNRKFSLAHLTVLPWTPPEMIYNAKLIGYDSVGIRSIYMGLPGEPNYDLSKKGRLYQLTKMALSETGLKICDAIEVAKIEKGRDVSSYELAFEAAAELGFADVISNIWTNDKDYYLDQFAKLCDLAKQYGLFVNLEFVTWASVKNLKEAKEVVNVVNRENACYLVDTLHFYRSKVNLSELDDIPKEKFRIVHICDGPSEIPITEEELASTGRGNRFYVGEGVIPVYDIVKRIGDNITLSLEIPNIQKVQDYGSTEHVRRCLETAKRYFDANDTECKCN